MPPLVRRLPRVALVVAVFATLLFPLAAQQPQKGPRPPQPRVTDKLPGGATIEELITHVPKYNRTIGVRGADGQMLLDFGTYTHIAPLYNSDRKLLKLERQATLPGGFSQTLHGLYDPAQRRFAVPCEYTSYRDLGGAFLVTRTVIKPKAPSVTLHGIYDPDAGRETFPCEATRIVEHEKKVIILQGPKEYGVFDAQGREVEPRRYTTLEYDAKLPIWRVKLASDAQSPSGYIDASGKSVTPVHFTSSEGFTGGAARAQRNGRYTFVDATGREPRPEGYAYLTPFRDGVAAFARRLTSPDTYNQRARATEWGFVTVAGVETAAAYEDVAHDRAPVLQNGRAVVKHGGRWLAVDPRRPQAEALAAAVPAQLEPFQNFVSYDAGEQAKQPWGFRIPGTDTVVPPRWPYVQPFHGAYAAVAFKGKLQRTNGKPSQEVYFWGFIDATGREALSPRYLSIKRLGEHVASFSQFDPAADRSRIGLLDMRTLQVVLPPTYEHELEPAGEGTTALRARVGNTWRLIDGTGRELTPLFDQLDYFREGFIRVRKGDHVYWLDLEFKPFLAERGYVKAEEFHRGRSRVYTGKPDQYGRFRGQTVINLKGEVIETYPDPAGAPPPPTASSAPLAQSSACVVCNGTGKQFRQVQVEYAGNAGSALRPYTPGGGSTTQYGSYTKSEYVGACTACDGRGIAKPFNKK